MIYFNRQFNRGWYFVAALLLVMAVFQTLDIAELRYQSNWWTSGDYWRGLSAHWVHANWKHLMLNAVGLVLCLTIAAPRWSIREWLVYNLYLGLGISTLFSLLNPELRWYVGYSGVLFGIYFLAAVDLYRRDRLIALILGAAVVGKAGLEQFSDLRLNSSDFVGVPVIVDAHWYGLLLGLSIALARPVYTIVFKQDKTDAES